MKQTKLNLTRIQSIDAFRALIMFLMIFVNDVAGVKSIPKWIEHTPADADGMGFSDYIFPAFLFIVGLSLPFALQKRLEKGNSHFTTLAHVFLRASALIIMGFFHVNLESYDSARAVFSYPSYTILLTLSFFLIWLDYPRQFPQKLRYLLIGIGLSGLIALAYVYKGGTAANPKTLEPSWWGILGIIGWAYLYSALSYLLFAKQQLLLILSFLTYASINVCSHLGLLSINMGTLGDASSVTLIMAGVLLASYYKNRKPNTADFKFLAYLFSFALLALAFGFFIRPFAGGISKIYATPAWVFICMGISIMLYSLLILIVDKMGKTTWFSLIRAGGSSTLTCYLLPYLVYSIFNLLDFWYPPYLSTGFLGICRSLLFSLFIIQIATILERKAIRLQV